MSYQQQQHQENGLVGTAGLEIFGGSFIKKNMNLISRMKRSLSASGKPAPLKLTRDPPFLTTNEWHSPLSKSSLKSPFNHTFNSPEHTKTSFMTEISPTAHLSYETFASSSSNLSIRTYPVTRRSSTNDSFIINSRSNNEEKIQAKMIFENKSLENEKATKLLKNESGVLRAPTPAMYWSRPTSFGIVPPKLRAHASAVFEDKMFVFGGAEKSRCSDTLYVFDLDTFTWSKPRVYGTSPPACRAHSFTADQENGQIYLFGGGDGHQYYDHLYILDISTMSWSRPETHGNKPSERRAHVTMIWHHSLYVFGGGDGTKALNDVFKLDLPSVRNDEGGKRKGREREGGEQGGERGEYKWTCLNTVKGPVPEAKGYHTGTLVNDKWIIYGGSDGKECFSSCHVLDLKEERWYEITQDIHVPRLSHSTLCVGSFLFIIGGHDGTKYCNNIMMLNLVTMNWETKRVCGQEPAPRGYHSTVLYDSRLFLFGGYNGHIFSNEVFVLELSSFAYLPQIIKFNINTQKTI